MKKLLLGIALLGVLFLSHTVWHWDSSAPTARWPESSLVVGENSTIVLQIEDAGRGLQFVEVTLSTSGNRQIVSSETFEASWAWQTGVHQHSLTFSPRTSLGEDPLPEGDFILEVVLRDQPNLWLWSNEVSARRSFTLDLTPPRIQILTDQHYIRQGGSEAIVYRVSKDTQASGVQVGEKIFQGYPLQDKTQTTYICLFALGHDQAPDSNMVVWAEDAAGNRGTGSFWKKTFPVRIRNRNIQLSDSLIDSLLPEILANQSEVSEQETPLETFLEINGHLRQINHHQIEEISSHSMGHLLWNEAFIQLSRSQVESLFADHRTYYYQGKPVDQQTHLGFDLASVTHGPVESANAGIVVFADYLGIYGNAVLVDHGLGLFSLYGHLSGLEVRKSQEVAAGQVLGRTGETGLAAGDHLHFSMILQGVQVNPLEWWDPRWVQQHVLDRVSAEWVQ
ncbi:MAG: M23 family metallopeptidase [Acidobacteriota bacterium]